MNKFLSRDSLGRFASAVLALSFLTVFALGAAQAYIRWTVNQNFTFLGGWGYESITLGAFALLIALILRKHE